MIGRMVDWCLVALILYALPGIIDKTGALIALF